MIGTFPLPPSRAITQARARGEVRGASEKADIEGHTRGAGHEVEEDMQLVCPQCRTETHGAKFCPQCGYRMALQVQCSGCSAALQPGTRFCTECGQRQPGT